MQQWTIIHVKVTEFRSKHWRQCSTKEIHMGLSVIHSCSGQVEWRAHKWNEYGICVFSSLLSHETDFVNLIITQNCLLQSLCKAVSHTPAKQLRTVPPTILKCSKFLSLKPSADNVCLLVCLFLFVCLLFFSCYISDEVDFTNHPATSPAIPVQSCILYNIGKKPP